MGDNKCKSPKPDFSKQEKIDLKPPAESMAKKAAKNEDKKSK